MEVIVHCGHPLTRDELTSGETAVRERCAAPAGHEGEHCADYWDFVYRLRQSAISKWSDMLIARRVPASLRNRLVMLVSEHYLESKAAWNDYSAQFSFTEFLEDFLRHHKF